MADQKLMSGLNQSETMSNLKKLNRFDLTMIVVSLVIGMGIFRTPVVVAAKTGSEGVFFLAWLAGGLIALCGALTYAEIGSRYPVTGGYYKIFSYGYHPSLAFAINCIILVSNAASTAAVAVIGAEYIGHFFYPGLVPDLFKQGITIGAVGVFYVINMLGLRMSSRVQNVLTLIKLSLILILLLSIFGSHPLSEMSGVGGAMAQGAGGAATHAAGGSVNPGMAVAGHAARVAISGTTQGPGGPLTFGFLKALGIGLIAVSFTYGGYQQSINFGGEVREPARIIPRGIGMGIAIIILLYLSLNFVYVKVIGFEQLKTADSIAAQLTYHLFGPVGETILRVLMFLSVLAYVNVLLMSNPRVMYAMSDEGILPAAFKFRTQERGVIVWSLTAFSIVIILTLLFSSKVEKIIDYSIFLDSIGMSTSAATIFILRRRRVGESGGNGDAEQKGLARKSADIYRMRLFPLLPLIFILAYIGVAASIVLDDPGSAAYGAGIFGCFFVLYFAVRAVQRFRRTRNSNS
jgi:APA family basic amino acid/polyamine antiporter